MPHDVSLLKCHFKLKGGVKTTTKAVHPGAKCQKCALCDTTSTTRWYHKVNKDADYLFKLKDKYGLTAKSCICSKCNNIVEETTKCKRHQVDKRKPE